MRSDTATTRRVRLVIVLSVTAAVMVMLGALVAAASLVMRFVTKHQPAHMTRAGLDMIVAGVAFGLVVLVAFAIARIGGAGRPRPRAGAADHRGGDGRPQPGGRERHPAGGPPAGGHAARVGARSARRPVLAPTNVYTPGGLIDVPRDGRAPGPPGSQPIPEILRTAGPPPPPGAAAGGRTPGTPAGGRTPGAPAGGRNRDRPPAGRAGNQPRPGYQQGVNPGGPARAPYAYGGQPMPPPREHGHPREAPRPGHAWPPREPHPPREPAPPRGPRPPREPVPPREGMPPPRAAPPSARPQAAREAPWPGTGAGGPGRPGGPVRPGGATPHDPGYRPPAGQGSGAGRHAAGPGRPAPGYPAPGGPAPGGPGHPPGGGRRPGAHAQPGPQEPGRPEAFGQFDGGYAPVIRAADVPVRPAGPARPQGFGRPAGPAGVPGPPARAGEAPAGVYVYRDTSDQPGGPAAAPGPDENDADYWYDLPGAGAGGGGGERKPHVTEEARGPFEPLVSSTDPPGTAPRSASGPDPGPGPAPPAVPGPQEGPAAGGEGGPQDTAHARARKLEQIKDLYLTAEAIGEANVDKHFDQLLAQQRELIGEYFRQSGAGRPAAATQGPPDPGTPTATENAGVAAEPPRAW